MSGKNIADSSAPSPAEGQSPHVSLYSESVSLAEKAEVNACAAFADVAQGAAAGISLVGAAAAEIDDFSEEDEDGSKEKHEKKQQDFSPEKIARRLEGSPSSSSSDEFMPASYSGYKKKNAASAAAKTTQSPRYGANAAAEASVSSAAQGASAAASSSAGGASGAAQGASAAASSASSASASAAPAAASGAATAGVGAVVTAVASAAKKMFDSARQGASGGGKEDKSALRGFGLASLLGPCIAIVAAVCLLFSCGSVASSWEEEELEVEISSLIRTFDADDFETEEELRQALVDYACSFIGVVEYKYGGKDITTGKLDCSGFTQAIYSAFGYEIGASTLVQRYAGTEIDYDDIQPGDLIYYPIYAAGGYYYRHVAIYIGDGMVVNNGGGLLHTSAADYRPIGSVRRIIDFSSDD